MATPDNSIQADAAAEIAGEATVDSVPSDRDSEDALNGVNLKGDSGMRRTGPLFDIESDVPAPVDEREDPRVG